MKKLTVALSIVLVLIFALFALGSSEDKSVDQGKDTADDATSTANLGEYNVEITSCRLAKDYEGKDVVIVKYIFTNVGDDDAAAFYTTLDATVYQNGIGLNEAYFLDDSASYISDNQTKEIKKGASIEVEEAYTLNDATADIEVEVTEWISFNNTKITKTFTITK